MEIIFLFKKEPQTLFSSLNKFNFFSQKHLYFTQVFFILFTHLYSQACHWRLKLPALYFDLHGCVVHNKT